MDSARPLSRATESNDVASAEEGSLRQGITISTSLVAQIQSGDAEAFRVLVRLIYTPLIHFAQSIVGSSDDAEDVVQDVFVSVWNLGPQWTPTGDPVAYLFASVRNHALDELRRRTRAEMRAQRAYEFDIDPQHIEARGAEQGMLDAFVDAEDTAERMRRVSAILKTLPERQRTAYALRYRQGLRISAIAEILGITAKSAEHLTARAARAVLDGLRGTSHPG